MHRLSNLLKLNPEDYEHWLIEDYMLVPTINTKDVIQDDFPVPCSSLKFAKKTFVPAMWN